MKESGEMSPPRWAGRIAGLLYLVVGVCGTYAEIFVRAKARVPGDAAATANNVRALASAFRLAFAADLVDFTCFLLVALALYSLFKTVNRTAAVAMLVINAVSVAIQSLNTVNHGAALLIATHAHYATAFGVAGSNALVMLFLDLHHLGYAIAQICFGLWLLPLGYLVVRSRFYPRALGFVLMLGGLGYEADLLVRFLWPGVNATVPLMLSIGAGLAETSFLLWVIVKRPNLPAQT